MLYPLTFEPQYFEKIWGGNRLKLLFDKKIPSSNIGESWEISSFEDAVSVVSNGFLKNNSLNELIMVYMGDLVGESIYEKYGDEFPLLIKFIDANDILSLQVHPNDEVAKELHKAYGKTEMWYVVHAEPESYIYLGFNKDTSQEEFVHHLDNGTLEEILNKVPVKAGDVFFIPAGRIHAIGAGIVLAEIQQTSDITYRVYDWNRLDKNGNPRELHIEEALQVIDYTALNEPYVFCQITDNQLSSLVSCPYFTTNIVRITKPFERDYDLFDSFKVYIFTKGKGKLIAQDSKENYSSGSVFLIPASIQQLSIVPDEETIMLETYIA